MSIVGNIKESTGKEESGERTGELMDNMTIFDMLYPTFKIDKPIRLIELFAGVEAKL